MDDIGARDCRPETQPLELLFNGKSENDCSAIGSDLQTGLIRCHGWPLVSDSFRVTCLKVATCLDDVRAVSPRFLAWLKLSEVKERLQWEAIEFPVVALIKNWP